MRVEINKHFASSVLFGQSVWIRSNKNSLENNCTRIEALCRFAGLPGQE